MKIQNFEKIFKTYYSELTIYACRFLDNRREAEDIVQNVFVRFWKRLQQKDTPVVSTRSFLYRMVRNASIDYLRSRKVSFHEDDIENLKQLSEELHSRMDYEQLQDDYKTGLELLPERCREVFLLSRRDSLKYSEIAHRLDISEKTVEKHISKALSLLKKHMKEHLF